MKTHQSEDSDFPVRLLSLILKLVAERILQPKESTLSRLQKNQLYPVDIPHLYLDLGWLFYLDETWEYEFVESSAQHVNYDAGYETVNELWACDEVTALYHKQYAMLSC